MLHWKFKFLYRITITPRVIWFMSQRYSLWTAKRLHEASSSLSKPTCRSMLRTEFPQTLQIVCATAQNISDRLRNRLKLLKSLAQPFKTCQSNSEGIESFTSKLWNKMSSLRTILTNRNMLARCWILYWKAHLIFYRPISSPEAFENPKLERRRLAKEVMKTEKVKPESRQYCIDASVVLNPTHWRLSMIQKKYIFFELFENFDFSKKNGIVMPKSILWDWVISFGNLFWDFRRWLDTRWTFPREDWDWSLLVPK